MKTISIIIVLFFALPIFSVAQTFNQTDANGLKQGKWSKTYGNGVPRYTGQFKNDKPFGEFKHYYENGTLKAITNYSPDGIVARTKTFHENSKPMAEGKFIKQKKDSIWNYYSEVDGRLISDETYRKGVLNGLSRTYYPETGNVAESIEFKNGKKQGELRKYFPEGNIMTEGTYVDDLLDGEFTLYFPDGSTQLKGQYKNGIQIGQWHYFDEQGNEINESEFKKEGD
jgi:antitoxin component YwqK of YwqJK toxin-antitoxin module